MPTPPAEFDITAELVHGLIADQHPDLAHLPIHGRVEGWDNVTVRIGDELAVRLPRRGIAVDLAEREHEFLGAIADRLDVGVPVPVRIGAPTEEYPFPWAIIPWFEGHSAGTEPPSPTEAGRLGGLLERLHQSAPSELSVSPYRGLPLTERLDVMQDRLRAASDPLGRFGLSIEAIWDRWEPMAQTPIDVDTVFVHGDLHPRNVLTADGMIEAIIDWGDMTPGDPATDLSAVWSLFDRDAHDSFWAAYGRVSQGTRQRTKAWAVYFAVLWIADAGDVEEFTTMGKQTLCRVLC